MDAKDILGLPKNSLPQEKKPRPQKDSQRKPDGISREVCTLTYTHTYKYTYVCVCVCVYARAYVCCMYLCVIGPYLLHLVNLAYSVL